MKKKTNVIVFGNQQICVDTLEILKRRHDVEIKAVVGCPQPLDEVFKYPSIKEYCKKEKLMYLEPEKPDRLLFKKLKKLNPEICFSIYYRKIFPAYFLKLAKVGFINIHNSLLPKNRGPVPTLWVLLNGDKTSGLTLHFIDKGVDTGDIIGQIKFKVPQNLTGYELNTFFMRKGVILFKKEIPKILSGKYIVVAQNHDKATYYGPFRQGMRIINWANKSNLILNQVRAFSRPYLGAIASILDKNIVIWNAKISLKRRHGLTGPGKIVKIFPDGSFIVSTANGYIRILEYEVQTAEQIEKGNYIKKGNRFNL